MEKKQIKRWVRILYKFEGGLNHKSDCKVIESNIGEIS